GRWCGGVCEARGRGPSAGVSRAEQGELAGRPVVLKVSAIEGSEPQTLAQLQHTHIVPIFSAHEDPRAGLRALCMPYFGGASLSQALRALWDENPRPTQGEELVRALDAVAAPATPPCTPPGSRGVQGGGVRGGGGGGGGADDQPPRAALGRLTYVQAVAWVVARLAEGLHHAHQRGVLHRDIKPSNILLGADAQPMLLDFNLAQDSHTD